MEKIKHIMLIFNRLINRKCIIILLIGFSTAVNIQAQNKDTILNVASDIIKSVQHCALISVDSVNEAHARTMEVFSTDKDFTLWFGTNIKSRKVKEIRENKKVTVYYQAGNGGGYVTVYGNAQIVEDKKETSKRFKKEWESYFTDKNDFALIKVIPYKLEIISYKNRINGNKKTWKAVNYKF